MTALLPDRQDLLEASQEDLRVAVRLALTRSGLTFAELAEQAEKGRFDSIRARRAWVAIGDLGHLADG